MWRYIGYAVAALAIVVLSCDNLGDTPVGPDPVPPPPTTTVPPEPPPHNPGPDFSWTNTRGVLLFAGTQGSEHEVSALVRYVSVRWPSKNLVFNVCSEVAEWESTPWADGPHAFSTENLGNLTRFLDTTAELGVLVRLNIFCTVRDNHSWMTQNAERYTRTVTKIVNDYNHVFLSVANEPYHPNSWFHNRDGRVRQVRDWARSAGFRGPMGADDNIGCPGCSFVYGYRNLGFPPDFHPYRNPDPNQRALDRIASENGGWAIISEPTAYSPWRDGNCCTSNKEQITSYMNRAERAGLTWFFHSTFGLEFPRRPLPEWIPQ